MRRVLVGACVALTVVLWALLAWGGADGGLWVWAAVAPVALFGSGVVAQRVSGGAALVVVGVLLELLFVPYVALSSPDGWATLWREPLVVIAPCFCLAPAVVPWWIWLLPVGRSS